MVAQREDIFAADPEPIRAFRLELDVPAGSWCTQAARQAGVALRVVGISALADGRVIEDVEVLGTRWRAAVDGMRTHAAVHALTLLHSDEGAATVRVVHGGCALSDAIATTQMLPRFPLRLHGRQERCTLVATARDARSFAGAAAQGGMATRLHAVSGARATGALTARQREVLDAARRLGYYDAPRRISLSGLASRLAIAKSTLSEMLVTIESKVMDASRE